MGSDLHSEGKLLQRPALDAEWANFPRCTRVLNVTLQSATGSAGSGGGEDRLDRTGKTD
jgi:hypothetical protein